MKYFAILPLLAACGGGSSHDTRYDNGVFVAECIANPPPSASKLPPAVVGPEKLRLLRGTVDSTGTISAGSGFTVQRMSPGQYKVVFDSPFPSMPTPVVSAYSPDYKGVKVARIELANVNCFLVRIESGDGVVHDTDFTFIVAGPR